MPFSAYRDCTFVHSFIGAFVRHEHKLLTLVSLYPSFTPFSAHLHLTRLSSWGLKLPAWISQLHIRFKPEKLKELWVGISVEIVYKGQISPSSPHQLFRYQPASSSKTTTLYILSFFALYQLHSPWTPCLFVPLSLPTASLLPKEPTFTFATKTSLAISNKAFSIPSLAGTLAPTDSLVRLISTMGSPSLAGLVGMRYMSYPQSFRFHSRLTLPRNVSTTLERIAKLLRYFNPYTFKSR